DRVVRQLGPRRGPARRIADHRGEIPDDEDRLVAEILELAELHQRHGVPEMDVRGARIDAVLDPQRPAGRQTRHELVLRKDVRGAAAEDRELFGGRHASTRWRTRSMAVARPVASSTSTTAPCTRTGPAATSNRTGIWVRNRSSTRSLRTPRIESSGPHI